MRHLSTVGADDFGQQVNTDVGGFFNLVSAVLPHLRRSQGSLVAVTTAATRRFAIRDGLSVAPKAAIEALIRGIAAEEGRFGVRANCVGPGMLVDGTPNGSSPTATSTTEHCRPPGTTPAGPVRLRRRRR